MPLVEAATDDARIIYLSRWRVGWSMSFYIGLNRRSIGDRRVLDSGGEYERIGDRRKFGSDRYVVVLGNTGIDRFGLMVGFPAALLIATVLVGAFVRV